MKLLEVLWSLGTDQTPLSYLNRSVMRERSPASASLIPALSYILLASMYNLTAI